VTIFGWPTTIIGWGESTIGWTHQKHPQGMVKQIELAKQYLGSFLLNVL